MYPFARMIWQILKYRKAPTLSVTGTHESRHICLPWDIDLWMELNNGRTLTLYDLGRIPMAYRTGLVRVLRANRWGLTVAGANVRYRRRIRMFETVSMRSRVVFWDDRFIYLEQSMWKKSGDCANHSLYRTAITGAGGLIPPAQAVQAMQADPVAPTPSDWITAWIASEDMRPWPPMQE